ncbi:MAG: 4-oxalocrotonate tautomerase [Rubrivivax sp.]|jgi:4-oxalocrotonate tautomerase
MPTLHVEFFAGRTVEQKRALAAALTEATVRTLGTAPETVQVLFHDIERHNWATGGVLWSDKAPPAPPPVQA